MLPDEQPFLDEVRQNPSDTTALLIYADYLDEAGDPRGEMIRLAARLTQLRAENSDVAGDWLLDCGIVQPVGLDPKKLINVGMTYVGHDGTKTTIKVAGQLESMNINSHVPHQPVYVGGRTLQYPAGPQRTTITLEVVEPRTISLSGLMEEEREFVNSGGKLYMTRESMTHGA